MSRGRNGPALPLFLSLAVPFAAVLGVWATPAHAQGRLSGMVFADALWNVQGSGVACTGMGSLRV